MLRNVAVTVRNPVISFRQTLLNDRAVHCSADFNVSNVIALEAESLSNDPGGSVRIGLLTASGAPAISASGSKPKHLPRLVTEARCRVI